MAQAPCKNTQNAKKTRPFWSRIFFLDFFEVMRQHFAAFKEIINLKKLNFAYFSVFFFLWLPGANHFQLLPHCSVSLQQCYQNHHHEILWISLVLHGLSSGYQFGLLPSDGFMQKVRKGSVITEQLLEIYATPSIAISLCSHCLLSGLWFSWVTLVGHISWSSPPQVSSCL